ncbi:MAG: hypothetical protein ACYTJ0_01310 [Planctomycetota bacterium]|jgi:hypothetical protein
MSFPSLFTILASAGAQQPLRLSPDEYLLLGYALGFALLIGYVINLWLVDRQLRKREGRDD